MTSYRKIVGGEFFSCRVVVIKSSAVVVLAPVFVGVAVADKLEVLNQEYARSKETRRKIWRILSIGLGIFCGIALVEILYVYGSILFAVLEPNSSVVGVIGGADGPTAIFVTSQLTGLLMHARVILPPVIGFLAAIWGIRKTRRH